MVNLSADQQFATNWARGRGILSGTETATGGLLDSRLSTSPSTNNEYRTALNDFRNTSGVRPTTVASQNSYQKDALFNMGKQPSFDASTINPYIQKQSGALDAAKGAVDRLGTPYQAYDQSTYTQFMNPYIKDVIQNNANEARRREAERRNGINESFAEAGGFGSTALGLERSRNASESERGISEMDAQLRAQGFDMATGRNMQLYEGNRADDLARKQGQVAGYLNVAGGYGSGGNEALKVDAYGREVNNNNLDRMLFAGDRVQGQNQSELDAFYQQDALKRQYPYTQNSYLADILSRYQTGETTTKTQPGVGVAQGALGGALVGSSFGGKGSFESGISSIGSRFGLDPLGVVPSRGTGPQLPWYAR
jgi:hypothetical protein